MFVRRWPKSTENGPISVEFGQGCGQESTGVQLMFNGVGLNFAKLCPADFGQFRPHKLSSMSAAPPPRKAENSGTQIQQYNVVRRMKYVRHFGACFGELRRDLGRAVSVLPQLADVGIFSLVECGPDLAPDTDQC